MFSDTPEAKGCASGEKVATIVQHGVREYRDKALSCQPRSCRSPLCPGHPQETDAGRLGYPANSPSRLLGNDCVTRTCTYSPRLGSDLPLTMKFNVLFWEVRPTT